MRNVLLYPAALLLLSVTPSQAQNYSDVFLAMSRSPLRVQSAPVDVRVMERKEIEEYLAGNPADLLEHTPSVYVRKMNGAHGASVISMRGFGSKQTAVVVDDIKIPSDLTGTVDLSALPAAGIDRIEILPGGWSPLYGANAEGGVIHISTLKLQPGARMAEAESEFSSYRGRLNLVKAGAAGRNVSASVSGSSEYTDGFQQNSAFVKNGATGVFSFAAPFAGRFSLLGMDDVSRIGLPSGTPALVIADWNGDKERKANQLDDYQKTERSLVSASYEVEPATHALLSVSAGVGTNVVGAWQFNSMTRITVQTRTVSAKLRLCDSVLGAEYERGVLSSDVYGRHTRRTGAVYGQQVLRPAEGLEVTPTARYDENHRVDTHDHGRSDHVLSPGIGLVYSPSFTWKFSARAAKAWQAPTFADLYDPYVPAADVPANLRPERSENFEAGAQWNSASGVYATVTGYRSDITDRIVLDPARSFAAYNMEKAFNQGVETELGYAGRKLRVSGAYSHNQSRGRVTAGKWNSLPFSPVHRVTLTADADTGLFRMFGKARSVSKQYTGRGHTGLRVPDFITADLRLSKRIGKIELSGGADNILDRHYAETADTTNGYYPQPGRVWRVAAKASF